MIIPMKKVALLCLEKDKAVSLEHLRELGLMQLDSIPVPEKGDAADLADSVACTERALGLIRASSRPKDKDNEAAETSLPGDDSEIVRRTLELSDRTTSIRKELDTLRRKENTLSPWGEFDRSAIARFREKGVFVVLCAAPVSAFREMERGKNGKAFPEDAVIQVVARDPVNVYYAAVFSRAPEQPLAEEVSLPEETLDQVRSRISELTAEDASLDKTLSSFKAGLPRLESLLAQQKSELEFATARDGMSHEGVISYLTGFVPETEIPRFRAAASEYGWACQFRDPLPGEQVPTYIRKPRFLNIMDPLFDFIGVQPGYEESDVNVFFLLFFPVFFGMIVGDAGYGLLFLLSALVCKRIFRDRPAARLPLNLFIMLSCASIAWGWLNGAWFGIPAKYLPCFMRGWSLLADPANNEFACRLTERLGMVTPDMAPERRAEVYAGLSDKFVQYICFLLAALHLGSARLFKFIEGISKSWTAVGHLGWAALIAANFFTAVNMIVFPGTFPMPLGLILYAAGVILVIGTTRGLGFFNLPFSLIGSFVDVLSYIRLFAVGLAGTYIAVNFNRMGVMLLDALPKSLFVLGLVFFFLVVLFGHLLNIALGFLSVMVHGIRLNTLEFSNHAELQWAGIRFRPFGFPFSNVNKETNSHS